MRGINIRLGQLTITLVAIFLAIISYAQITLASPVAPNKIIELTNETRIKNNVNTLSVSSVLSESAQKKANDMIVRNYWSHETPDGAPFYSFVDRQNYDWQYLGENLAANFQTSENMQSAWLASELHRKNILNPNYQDVGVGISNDIVVVLYGRKDESNINFPLVQISDILNKLYSNILGWQIAR